MATSGQYYAVLNQLGGNGSFTFKLGTAIPLGSSIDMALSKVGSSNYTTFFQIAGHREWTSSEHSPGSGSYSALAAGYYSKGNVYIGTYTASNKWNNIWSVRPFLAF